jgi:predicted acetyltransferase
MSKLDIQVISANHQQLPLMHRLARLYRYDLSEFADWPVPAGGDYVYQGLEDYWLDGYEPLLIFVESQPAGFVILAQGEKADAADYECVEFFVMRKFRGQGVGKHVALQLFNQYRGQWVIKQLVANKPAIAFWNKTVSGYTNNIFDSSVKLDQEFGEIYLICFDNS